MASVDFSKVVGTLYVFLMKSLVASFIPAKLVLWVPSWRSERSFLRSEHSFFVLGRVCGALAAFLAGPLDDPKSLPVAS